MSNENKRKAAMKNYKKAQAKYRRARLPGPIGIDISDGINPVEWVPIVGRFVRVYRAAKKLEEAEKQFKEVYGRKPTFWEKLK